MKPKDIERFHTKYIKIGADDCWEWLAAKRGCGASGDFILDNRGERPQRVMKFLTDGFINPDKVVLTICGNKNCVNPRHLEYPIELKYLVGELKSGQYLHNDNTLWEFNERDKKRFYSKFKIGKPEECWNWEGTKTNGGRGQFSMGKNLSAHRLSWFFEKGCISSNKLLLHSCDNPSCVNPNHLREGTFQDNSNDMKERNRACKTGGELKESAKLTWKEIDEIRKLYKEGLTQTEIGLKFNVTQSNIGCICRGKTWNEKYRTK